MTVADVFVALLVAGLSLVAAKLLRGAIPLFRKLFMPASVIAGVLALLLGPQALGRLPLPRRSTTACCRRPCSTSGRSCRAC
jgi:glutamate:Na+ symporter, ESS family